MRLDCFRPIYRESTWSLIDIANYGYGEKMIPELVEYLYNKKDRGVQSS